MTPLPAPARALFAALRAVALSGMVAGSAAAATWTVNTTSDAAPTTSECAGLPGDCSLRQAIAKAAPGDTVTLPAGATPYAVTLGVVAVNNAITIAGAGARTTTIEGSGNAGSGIFTFGGNVTVSGVRISGGSTSGSGGAIDITSGSVALDDVALSDDAASDGGAIELTSDGSLTISDSTLGPGDTADGSGGGLGGAVDNNGGLLTITDSTITGDNATGGGAGGGISTENGGQTTLDYDTVAFNSATGSGAGGGDLASENPGNDPAGFIISHSVVADGAAPIGGDCYGIPNDDAGYLSDGYNLTDGIASTGTAGCGFTQSTDLLGDARLGALTNNGGQTDTEALAAGSPAIDAIPTSNASCTGTDQRGVSRPQGSGCDGGALEAGGGETAPQWNPAHDFRAPSMENPSPDSLGNSDVWSYEQAPLADVNQPTDYTLLPSGGPATNCTGPSFYAWANPGPSLPVVDFNAGTTTYVCSTARRRRPGRWSCTRRGPTTRSSRGRAPCPARSRSRARSSRWTPTAAAARPGP